MADWTPPVLLAADRAAVVLTPGEIVYDQASDRFARATGAHTLSPLAELSDLQAAGGRSAIGGLSRGFVAGVGTYAVPGQPARPNTIIYGAAQATYVRADGATRTISGVSDTCQCDANGPIGLHGRTFQQTPPGRQFYVLSAYSDDHPEQGVVSWATLSRANPAYPPGWNAGNTYFGPWAWNQYDTGGNVLNIRAEGAYSAYQRGALPRLSSGPRSDPTRSGPIKYAQVDLSPAVPAEATRVLVIVAQGDAYTSRFAPDPAYGNDATASYPPVLLTRATSDSYWMQLEDYYDRTGFYFTDSPTAALYVAAWEARV